MIAGSYHAQWESEEKSIPPLEFSFANANFYKKLMRADSHWNMEHFVSISLKGGMSERVRVRFIELA